MNETLSDRDEQDGYERAVRNWIKKKNKNNMTRPLRDVTR